MPEGYVVLVLHAHLPYVLSHGKWPYGTDWLCEAACECYIPLANLLDRLSMQGKAAHFTINMTPVLCEMLASPSFRSAFEEYAREKAEAAYIDRRTFEARGETALAALAEGWERFYALCLADFKNRYGSDLPGAYRRLQEEGQVEIVASAATHAYLPLLSLDASIDAQVSQGVATYRRYFAREPAGMWLPECAYRQAGPASVGRSYAPARRGIEDFLAAHGIRYFFVDGRQAARQAGPAASSFTADVMPPLDEGAYQGGYYNAAPRRTGRAATSRGDSDFDVYGIYKTAGPGAQVAFFSRDTDTSSQVWGSDGYPGDPSYLEFHKKRDPGGLRYWRVTDRQTGLGDKMVYEPGQAAARVEEHARHFARLIEGRLSDYRKETGRTGVLTLLFDAELFGHWWFEGVSWLGALVSALDPNYVTIERASTALKSVDPRGAVSLPEGSWGEGGRHLLWYNKETAWMWQRLYEAERDMARAVETAGSDGITGRLLRQMARELFLAQSSDWPFLVSTHTAGDYGESRFLGHYDAWKALYDMLGRIQKSGVAANADKEALAAIEKEDDLFDDVNPDWFSERTEDGL